MDNKLLIFEGQQTISFQRQYCLKSLANGEILSKMDRNMTILNSWNKCGPFTYMHNFFSKGMHLHQKLYKFSICYSTFLLHEVPAFKLVSIS